MRSAILCLAFVAFGTVAAAHPGRTDASGGHYDRKNGGYHYHGGGVSLPEPRATVRIEPRTTARTSARTTTVTQPRFVSQTPDRGEAEARLAEAQLAAEKAAADLREKELAEREPRLREAEAKRQAEAEELSRAKYRLHMSIGTIKLIADFKDQGSTYYVTTINGGHVAYPKVMVKKIEPIDVETKPAG